MIVVAVEGYPDSEAVGSILRYVGLSDPTMIIKRGKSQLDAALPELNRSARSLRCLVVRDLDNDECVPELLSTLLPKPAPNMLFRVAVREIESWLIADRKRFATFLGVPEHRVPTDPDTVPDPKSFVTKLARASSLSRIREGIPPRQGSGIPVGPGYAGIIGEYASAHWRPEFAAKSSKSLARCISKLRSWC